MNITEEQSREAFEAWSRDGHVSTFDLVTSKNGRYLSGDVHCAWEGWQAAIRFAQGHLTTPPKITSVVKAEPLDMETVVGTYYRGGEQIP